MKQKLDHVRCVICNSVNHSEIAFQESEFFSGGFFELESYGESGAPAFVCSECESEHRDVMTEWDMEDEDADSE